MGANKAALRFVRLLLVKGAASERLAGEIRVRANNHSARLPIKILGALVSEGVLDWQGELPVPTGQTRGWLKRLLSSAGEGAGSKGTWDKRTGNKETWDKSAGDKAQTEPQCYANQHRKIRLETLTPSNEARHQAYQLVRNDNESPLTRLAQLKRPDGTPYIVPYHIIAGERLRSDFDKSRLGAATTMNWNAAFAGSGGSGFSGTDISDMAIDARTRLAKIHASMGSEMAGVLIDFCGYLKGLETIEQERGWPRRSAKLAIRLALDQLARHYGLAQTGTGNEQTGNIRTWGKKPDSATIGAS